MLGKDLPSLIRLMPLRFYTIFQKIGLNQNISAFCEVSRTKGRGILCRVCYAGGEHPGQKNKKVAATRLLALFITMYQINCQNDFHFPRLYNFFYFPVRSA